LTVRVKDFFDASEAIDSYGNVDRTVTGLTQDSRAVTEGSLFFAVSGARLDGHEFAGEAVTRGAAAVVLERKVRLPDGATWIQVRNVRRTMGEWAAMFFSHPSRRMALVGVTGTNGKTTVTYLLESIFRAAGLAPGVIGTVNYRYQGQTYSAPNTTPESLDLQALLAEMAEAGVRSVAMEVSSHALALERVREVDFDGAVFTNLSRDHLDFHVDMESYFSAKEKLFTDCLAGSSKEKRFAVIHGEDPRGKTLLQKIRGMEVYSLSYGRGEGWDIHPVEVASDLEGLRGTIRMGDRSVDFSSRLLGWTNLENILAASGVGYALGIEPGIIAEGVARLKSVPGRLERIENRSGQTILVDYAHTPDALERALGQLRPLTRGRLIALFGCGGDRDRGKRPVMGEIAARLSDFVVLTSDNPRSEDPLQILLEVEGGVKRTAMKKFQIAGLKSQNRNLPAEILNLKSYLVEPDRRAAIRLAVSLARPGDLVLLAGKGHEDYQIVGSKRIHFDDREVAREELSHLGGL
jgi:UDP-N-acetylmuramoyl-L-alanyl-D-glutamate--2,6-diaminopimelate ligase